jgi:hypothetical protein
MQIQTDNIGTKEQAGFCHSKKERNIIIRGQFQEERISTETTADNQHHVQAAASNGPKVKTKLVYVGML